MIASELYKNIGTVLISKEELQNKVRSLGEQISQDFKGEEVVLISNLKGSFRFLSDLSASLTVPTQVDFVSFTSYHGGTESTGEMRIIKDLKMPIENKNVIVVEDIVDTGYTIDFILKYFQNFRAPKSVKICTLLDKKEKRQVEVPVDYAGFLVPDLFLIGYGLDYKEYFRELNFIAEYNI